MATRTSYLKLIKPGYDDAADVADLNANMDTIDSTIKTIDEDGGRRCSHQPAVRVGVFRETDCHGRQRDLD